MYQAYIPTELGRIEVLFSSKGICRLILPGMSIHTERRGGHDKGGDKSPSYLPELGKQLVNYSKGLPLTIEFPLDLSGASDFCQHVWHIVKEIPFGETRSYGWVASKTGNIAAARAVGGALARNPVPLLIPCHRVINCNGTPGGFAGKMSCIQTKLTLLSLEGLYFKQLCLSD
ncbi:MAG: methylated-DNA--[protein]-cysteine S-methyltransferase [Dehalococcoidia bacterium]|nr:methylated-DNA--[protein]-cysteine S-methyltransferase [Dehalococcoidia bacterium]